MGASCVLLGTAFGTGLTLAVFLKPLTEEFGWSRGAINLAYSAFMLLTGFSSPLMGHLGDRASRGEVSLGRGLLQPWPSIWAIRAAQGTCCLCM